MHKKHEKKEYKEHEKHKHHEGYKHDEKKYVKKDSMTALKAKMAK